MKLIYMQRTIDYALKLNRIDEINVLGTPEVVELTDDKGNTINKYYLWKNKEILKN